MSGELEALLRLVSEGKITAEEAAPIVAALEEKARSEDSKAGASERGSRVFQDLLTDRRLRVYVAENGRPVIDIRIPMAAAGFAIDQVPGLSEDHRSRIAEAIQAGTTGPVVEVSDGHDEVRVTIE
jgi:hypothetical protein